MANQGYNVVNIQEEEGDGLKFQSKCFSPTSASPSGAGAGPSTAPPPYSDIGRLESQPAVPASNSMFNLDYYRQYFNVDTNQVLTRAKASIVPSGSFIDATALTPDLYGPFWIPTTVIFTCFVTSSIAGSIAAYLSQKPYAYDLGVLSFAVTTIYTYVGGMSLAVWLAAKYTGCQASWLELISVYGYGMTVWIPVSVLCVLPYNSLRWLLVIAGAAISGLFIFQNTRQVLARSQHRWTQSLLLIVLGAHAIMALIFKLEFFSYSVEWPSAGTPAPETPAPSF
ncbi:hypothetical protein THASP1DRAFT_32525 [Thamnocephalis sphaerospora]|uniref:Protein YIP n=1 Tax=Thamnocephalis sphaerospora TaxID=78915 RepID=A0A4P9XIU4_9FUNG|nr:hypothetical protein THASP1DRAFT_32525 [Thamnocephalis sphaerospora]|eukprot:RKP05637.1 hypothetical protein THASP1DRAFT_32525 [Thamnocephalis sphaerospora]